MRQVIKTLLPPVWLPILRKIERLINQRILEKGGKISAFFSIQKSALETTCFFVFVCFLSREKSLFHIAHKFEKKYFREIPFLRHCAWVVRFPFFGSKMVEKRCYEFEKKHSSDKNFNILYSKVNILADFINSNHSNHESISKEIYSKTKINFDYLILSAIKKKSVRELGAMQSLINLTIENIKPYWALLSENFDAVELLENKYPISHKSPLWCWLTYESIVYKDERATKILEANNVLDPYYLTVINPRIKGLRVDAIIKHQMDQILVNSTRMDIKSDRVIPPIAEPWFIGKDIEARSKFNVEVDVDDHVERLLDQRYPLLKAPRSKRAANKNLLNLQMRDFLYNILRRSIRTMDEHHRDNATLASSPSSTEIQVYLDKVSNAIFDNLRLDNLKIPKNKRTVCLVSKSDQVNLNLGQYLQKHLKDNMTLNLGLFHNSFLNIATNFGKAFSDDVQQVIDTCVDPIIHNFLTNIQDLDFLNVRLTSEDARYTIWDRMPPQAMINLLHSSLSAALTISIFSKMDIEYLFFIPSRAYAQGKVSIELANTNINTVDIQNVLRSGNARYVQPIAKTSLCFNYQQSVFANKATRIAQFKTKTIEMRPLIIDKLLEDGKLTLKARNNPNSGKYLALIMQPGFDDYFFEIVNYFSNGGRPRFKKIFVCVHPRDKGNRIVRALNDSKYYGKFVAVFDTYKYVNKSHVVLSLFSNVLIHASYTNRLVVSYSPRSVETPVSFSGYDIHKIDNIEDFPSMFETQGLKEVKEKQKSFNDLYRELY